jgi:hypothetical protein
VMNHRSGSRLFCFRPTGLAPAAANTRPFQRGQTLFEARGILEGHPTPAPFDNALAAFEHALANRIMLDSHCNIMQQPQQPEADRGIGRSMDANLLDSGVQQPFKIDPW